MKAPNRGATAWAAGRPAPAGARSPDGGYHERMSFTFLLSLLALVLVLGVAASIFIGGALYVGRVRRKGPGAVLSGARKRRELRA